MQHLTVALTDQDLTLEHKQGEYYLDTHVEFQQVVALSHLLLASGAFPPAEMKSIMTTLLNHFAGSERHRLKQALAHDVEAYLPYNREVPLLEMIGTLTDAITEQKAVTFTYRSRRSLTRVKLNRRHTGKPGALFVNNNRFYVALFEHETQRADHYYLYRLDRIVKIEKPRVNLSLKPGRFDLQAYRQHNYLLFDSEHVRVHLLYQDYPQTLKEAFPTAQQLKKNTRMRKIGGNS